jgi:hypothetical protein
MSWRSGPPGKRERPVDREFSPNITKREFSNSYDPSEASGD